MSKYEFLQDDIVSACQAIGGTLVNGTFLDEVLAANKVLEEVKFLYFLYIILRTMDGRTIVPCRERKEQLFGHLLCL